MKKLLLTLLALGVISFTGLQSSEPFDSDNYSEKNSATTYANAYSDTAQTGISPNGIIKLTKLDAPNGSRIKLSSDGGLVVPVKGNYLINYRVLISTQSSLALFRNNNVIPTSAFSNLTSISPIGGMTIIELNAGDKITIRNIDNAKNVNTLIPAGSTYPPIPVSLTIARGD